MMMIGIAHMAEMGLLTSVAAPLIAAQPRRGRWRWMDALTPPATPTFLGFLLLHAVIVLAMAYGLVPGVWNQPAHGLLLAASVLFWLPVLGTRRRISDPARTVYLFLSMPPLDLPAVWVIARGDAPGGLAMIVAMMPVGLTAIVVTVRWMRREEALADQIADGADDHRAPAPLHGREVT